MGGHNRQCLAELKTEFLERIKDIGLGIRDEKSGGGLAGHWGHPSCGVPAVGRGPGHRSGGH